MKNKLIVNADDFGYTPGVTYGIIEAHEKGIVSSTTALVLTNYFEEAMKLALHKPSLNVGIHLTLTLHGKGPILGEEVPSLINDKGVFWSQGEFLSHVKAQEVYLEWDAQIAKFLSTGIRPSHIDSHHNVHGANEEMLSIAIKLAKKYKLPLRKASRSAETAYLDKQYGEVSSTDILISSFYGKNATKEHLIDILNNIGKDENKTYELNCHPAFIDPVLVEETTYLEPRLSEWQILTSNEIKEAIRKNKIQLINYEYIK